MKRRHFLNATLGAAAYWPLARAADIDRTMRDVLGAELPARSLDGGAITIPTSHVVELSSALRGSVLLAGDPAYEEARQVWNATWDRRPALIVRCESPADVMQAVDFARDHRLLTAVKAGGHSASGKSTCDGGIMIDLHSMNSVRVDPVARRARIDSGVLLRDLDRETRQFGLVTTAGTVGHTGAAGLTLGGGFGRVGRRFGLSCDNLVAADVVTADGRLVHASDVENPDLLWGLRGGGGNFGVATSLEYVLHPMDPIILGGIVQWPLAQLGDVLRFLADFTRQTPDELNLDVSIVPAGPRAGILAEVCWSAEHSAGEKAVAPLRSFGKPVQDTVGPMPYFTLQTSADGFLRHGQRHYGKAGFVDELPDTLIEHVVATFTANPPPRFAMSLQQSGGAIGRVPVDATAFPNRKIKFWMMMSGLWQEPGESDARVAEIRTAWSGVEPYTTGFYVNAMTEDMYKGVRENYGTNYPRLQKLKKKYDPGNQFRLNANVAPA